jgi:hypothetical protein
MRPSDITEMSEFLPYLRLGQSVGVGRQAVWGKGEMENNFQ